MASKANESGTKVVRQRSKATTSEKALTDQPKAEEKATKRRTAATAETAKPKATRQTKPQAKAPAKAQAKPKTTAAKAASKKTTAATSADKAPSTRKPRATAKTTATAKPRAARKAAKPAPEKATTEATPAEKVSAKPTAKPAAQPMPEAAAAAVEAAFSKAMSAEGSASVAQNMAENLERIEVLSQRLLGALSRRPATNPAVEMPGPDLYVTAASAWMKMLAEQPSRVIEQQVNFWGETLKHYVRAQQALTRGTAPDDEEAPRRDKRFANPLWRTNPFFNFVKRQYEINAEAMSNAAAELELPDETARRRTNWLTSQIIDMMAPTNFLATNPDALEKAVQTEGESLVKGLENLVRDVELNSGEVLVSLADRDAFTVGENIGTAEGTVVHRTPLFELIQYKPTTEKVHALPLVIFPPWINKFYILDLKPQNSLIRYLVDQGYTLFVVSWKNPDPSYADTGIDDYVAAYLDVIDTILTLTGEKKLNAVGYCIAGTTLSLALGLMSKRGDKRVNSATFFTTLTDFSDQGEFTTFLQDDFIDGIEAEVMRQGILKSQIMSRTMSFLRANDLVWGPAIRSYMMGETPPAFDLLFWNGDSTNLPAAMTVEYLRGLCQRNALATDGFTVMGERVQLGDITLPLCSVACETDHIAPWKDCWRGVSLMGSKEKSFILSESGHIAGIVNPPSKKKYGHYAGGSDFSHGHQAWKDAATFTEGSWWPRWDGWLAERSGGMVPARDAGKGYGPAPGTYVHERGGVEATAETEG